MSIPLGYALIFAILTAGAVVLRYTTDLGWSPLGLVFGLFFLDVIIEAM